MRTKCSKCPLGEGNYVCKGNGPKDAKIMIVGEAPGFHEASTGKPFQGKAGQLLDRVLKESGIGRETCYVTNVCKCRPPDNRTPKPKEIEACMPRLWREVERVKPEIMVLLGNTALQAVTGLKGIKSLRGEWIEVEGLAIMPTYHPAALSRNPNWLPKFKSDIMKVANLATGNTSQIDDIPYTFVKTKEDLSRFLETAKKAVDHSYDIETIIDTDTILCQASAFEMPDGEIRCFFIPLAHRQSPFKKVWKKVLKIMAPTIERKGLYANLKTTGQNAKFDNKKYRANVDCNPYLSFDTMLAGHLLDENTPNDLGYLSATYANAPPYKEEVDKTKLNETDILKVAKYNVGDAYWTLKTKQVQKKLLKKDGRLWKIFLHCTMPGARALERAEHYGVYLDKEQILKASTVSLNAMAEQLREMSQFLPEGYVIETCVNCRRREGDKRLQPCPTPETIREGYRCKKYSAPKGIETFNLGSPKQVGWLLFDVCEIDPVHYNEESGNPSTAEDSLVYMDHPLVEIILKFREHQKLWTTYLRPWLESMDENNRIYVSAKIHGTVTGRLAYAKPSPQTVPRNVEIRSCIAAPPGWVMMEIDYSQIELRAVAHAAPEPTMLRIYQTGGDIHWTTALEVIGGTGNEEIIELAEDTATVYCVQHHVLPNGTSAEILRNLWNLKKKGLQPEEIIQLASTAWFNNKSGYWKWRDAKLNLKSLLERRFPSLAKEKFSEELLRIVWSYQKLVLTPQELESQRLGRVEFGDALSLLSSMDPSVAQEIHKEWKDYRKKAKAVGFGFVYGMGWRKFMEYAKSSYGVDFTEEEAKALRISYFNKYQGLKPWHDRQKRIAKQLGFVRSAFGRKRRLPDIYSDEEGKRAEAERQSVNSPIQALPPDMTMMAMGIMENIPGMWVECRIVFQVHDAILFYVRKDKKDKWAKIGKEIMENLPTYEVFGMEFQVPIIAEPQLGPAWGKGVEWHESK